MTETLLSYLVKRNPRVVAPGLGGSTFAFSEDWDTIEDVEEWTEFNYDTLTRRFGEDLQRQVSRFDATTKCEEGGYNTLYDERGLCDLVCMSITGPVSAVLGPLFIASGGRVLENLGCYPDWGAGHEGIMNANGRAKALALGDTKFKWSTTNAINTVQTRIDDSYEDAPMRDDVRPLEQVQYYGAVYKCRHVFVITEKELVVMQLHLAPDPVRTSPKPVRTRQPPPSHQRVVSSSTVSRQLTDMSIEESVPKARIGLVKYKRILWSVENGLTIKLALYCLIRLAVEDGSDLKTEYPSLVSPRASQIFQNRCQQSSRPGFHSLVKARAKFRTPPLLWPLRVASPVIHRRPTKWKTNTAMSKLLGTNLILGITMLWVIRLMRILDY